MLVSDENDNGGNFLVRLFYLTKGGNADGHHPYPKSKNICDDEPKPKIHSGEKRAKYYLIFLFEIFIGSKAIFIRHLKSGYCIESKTEISCESKLSSLS